MNSPSTQVTYSNLFNTSWDAMKNQLFLVAGLTLVWTLGVGALSFIPAIGWMMTGPFTAGYLRSLLKIRAGETIGFEDIFWGFTDVNRLIHLVLVGFLVGIITLIGFICLVIPGIYLGVATFLATQVLVVHGTDSVESIKRSMEIVKGRWWWFLGLTVLIGFLNLAGFLCFIVGIFVTIPLSNYILLRAVELISPEKGFKIEALSDAGVAAPPQGQTTASVFPVNPGQ